MLLLHINSHVDVLIRDDPLQHRRNLRISKSKKMCHSIDRDVIISSTDLATSTAFIHNIPRLRQPEQEQVSIFKLVFHHWKTAVSKNSPKRTSIKRFSKINSFCMTLRIQIWNFLAKRNVGLAQFWNSSFPNTSPRSSIFHVSFGIDLQEADANFFEFSKSAEYGPTRTNRVSETCPDVLQWILCDILQTRIAANHSSWTRNTHKMTGTWDKPKLVAISKSQKTFAYFKEFTLSCDSWIWSL